MSESGRGSLAVSAGSFVGTFALIVAAIAGLFAIDTFLAETDRAASQAEARRLFAEGVRLQQQGRMPEALERLRSAVSAERQNPEYERALAATLLAAGRLPDAQAVLAERMQHDPTDAEAGLLMARTLAREGMARQAIAFYHRAIFGDWGEGGAHRKVEARFELVELLAVEHARQELLAELLPLEVEAPDDPATRKRIANLFLAAGAPAVAAAIFREIVRGNRADADGHAGLGEAEFQRGNYGSARKDFAAALALRPGDPRLAARLELCDRVLALDPAQRGIGGNEQYRRSGSLLELALATVDSCAAGPGPAGSRAPLLDSARTALARPVPATDRAEAAEARVNLAERVWQARPERCPLPAWARPAELVLSRLAE